MKPWQRGGEITCDGAGEQRVVERVEVRQEAVFRRRRQVDWFAVGRDRAGRIDGVERIRDQDRRLAGARLDEPLGRDRRQKQALAGTAEDQHLARRVDRARQPVASVDPGRRCLAEARDAFVGWIAAEFRDMRLQHRPDERRDRVLRLADREVDRRLAGRDVGKELGEPHERRALLGPGRGGERHGIGGTHGKLSCKGGSPHAGNLRRGEVKARLTIAIPDWQRGARGRRP
jgi:hypothetical protein